MGEKIGIHKYIFWPKLNSDFKSGPPHLACLYTWGEDIQKSLREPHAKIRPQPRNLSNKQFTKSFFFFSKFHILFACLPRRRSPAELTAGWRYRLPIKNWTPHYNNQFCISFLFCYNQEARFNVYKHVKIGPKINLVHCKLLWWCLLYTAGLVLNISML